MFGHFGICFVSSFFVYQIHGVNIDGHRNLNANKMCFPVFGFGQIGLDHESAFSPWNVVINMLVTFRSQLFKHLILLFARFRAGIRSG